MGRSVKYSKETKLKAINEYLRKEKTIIELSEELSCSRRSIFDWIKGYTSQGESYLEEKKKNNKYTKEFKEMVIKDYLSSKESYSKISNKYKITSKELVRTWVEKYNKKENFKDYIPKNEIYTMKVTPTTFEEKKDIVMFCINNNKDYKLTATEFNVPYKLVYHLVNRYLKEGINAIHYEKKGPNTIRKQFLLNELEQLKLENELLRIENQKLKINTEENN